MDSLNGIVDRVFLSQRDGSEEAELSMRVFTNDFKQAVDFLEGQGRVQSKELVEGIPPPDGTNMSPTRPDSRITLVLVGKEDSSNTGLIVAIAAPLGSIGLVIVLGLLFLLVYRAGRHRGQLS